MSPLLSLRIAERKIQCVERLSWADVRSLSTSLHLPPIGNQIARLTSQIVTNHEIAERLLALVGRVGEGTRSAIRAGEDTIAIAELMELAAIEQISVPDVLLVAVREIVADGPGMPLDVDDIAALAEDIDTVMKIGQR